MDNVETIVEAMLNIVTENTPQPLSNRKIHMIHRQGFPFVSNGAAGFERGEPARLGLVEEGRVWELAKRELLFAIGRNPDDDFSNSLHRLVASLLVSGLDSIEPAGQKPGSTVWRALLNSAFQSLWEKTQLPLNYHIKHRNQANEVNIMNMAKDTVAWYRTMLQTEAMWTNIRGQKDKVRPLPSYGIAYVLQPGDTQAWMAFITCTLLSHPIAPTEPKLISALTEVRCGNQAFCQRLKSQGKRLNPAYVVEVSKAWIATGLWFHQEIGKYIATHWPVLNDPEQRPFVVCPGRGRLRARHQPEPHLLPGTHRLDLR